MLTKSTRSAIRALVFLGSQKTQKPVSPKTIAAMIGESPSYLAKVLGQLAKAGILEPHRGASGGFTLRRSAARITLREIIEAAQGPILGDFCQETPVGMDTCAFHKAAEELHHAILKTLNRWRLADLMEHPVPEPCLRRRNPCVLMPLPVSKPG